MAVKKAKAGTPQGKSELQVTLVRSLIGCLPEQRAVAKGLGLKKINSTVVRRDTPEIRGMIRKISHLVKVEGGEIS